jgi:transposase
MAWHNGQAYAQDLRDRVLGAQGSIRDVAERFGVSQSYVARARSKRRRCGEDTPGVQRNHVAPKLGRVDAALTSRVSALPDQTLAQLCQWALDVHGIRVSVTTMWKRLNQLGLSFKKNH